MPRGPLVLCRLLDPRPAVLAAARPIAGAVNIPFVELPARTHELPPRRRSPHAEPASTRPGRANRPPAGPETNPLLVAEDPTGETVAWLRSRGRDATPAASYAFSAGPPAYVGRLWRPNAFLEELMPQLVPVSPPAAVVAAPTAALHAAPGRALDLACGVGREAVFLAAAGWRVLGVDILPDALARGRALAEHCAPAIEPIEWRALNLESQPAAALFGPAEFDLITSFRYLHRPLLRGLVERCLRPGGSLVIETFTTEHRAQHGRPSSDAHVLRPGELAELLATFDLRHYSEGWRGADHTARAWAVRR